MNKTKLRRLDPQPEDLTTHKGPCVGSCEKVGVRTREAVKTLLDRLDKAAHALPGAEEIHRDVHMLAAVLSDTPGIVADGLREFDEEREAARAEAQAEQSRKDAEPVAWIDGVIQDVCELPDRDSPPDEPDLLQVSVDELRLILQRNAPQPDDQTAKIAEQAATIAALREALKTTCKALGRVETERMVSYKARNGRDCYIQADDGERCDILHSDITFECKNAFDDARKALAATEKE